MVAGEKFSRSWGTWQHDSINVVDTEFPLHMLLCGALGLISFNRAFSNVYKIEMCQSHVLLRHTAHFLKNYSFIFGLSNWEKHMLWRFHACLLLKITGWVFSLKFHRSDMAWHEGNETKQSISTTHWYRSLQYMREIWIYKILKISTNIFFYICIVILFS